MKKAIAVPCYLSRLIFIYGFFTLLCQLSFLYLSASIFLDTNSAEMFRYIYFPYLEYPILSFTLIIGGGLLVDYICLRDFL